MVAGSAGLGLAPGRPREIRVIPLRTVYGVTVGPGPARLPGVVDAIRKIPDIGAVRLSPVGGTIGPGGPDWLHLLMVASLPQPLTRPLDVLLAAALGTLERRLIRHRLELTPGKVTGAWCPGFSDLSVGGKKLVGVGFKLTREVALMRAVVGLRMPPPAHLLALDISHRTFGPGIAGDRLTWLGDLVGMPGLTQEEAIPLFAGEEDPRPEKILE
ncbi:MAG: hypothetical protein ACYCX9_02945 [Candidatus Dormibacteria bacterium]|jgi:hypothetical protein